MNADDIKESWDRAGRTILTSLEIWTQIGSGLFVDKVEILWLDIAKYQAFKGVSYINLPEILKDKKAIINVKNTNDDDCLRLAIQSALFQVEQHSARTSS